MIADTVAKIEQYTKEDVLHLLDRVTRIFSKEARLLQLPKKPLLFVGDTHGDWNATKQLLSQFWETAAVFVFLGDYVDRGPHQIENINLLLELKTKSPKRLMILRGNHETPRVNRSYGFYDVVKETLGDVIDYYWQTFSKMPLAAISQSRKIFAVHGGIPENLVDIEEINSFPQEIEPEHPMTIQLLWNDPRETLRGFGPSMRGSRIRTFGQDVVEEFMTQNSLVLIVRAHEVFPHGYHEFFDGRILSLFSCKDYRVPIAGKALHVNDSGDRELIAI